MKQAKRIITARKITLGLVFAAVIASLAFDIGLGTPSSFGVGEFSLLCPLGGFEAMLASNSFLPSAAISLVVILVFTAIFGRVWCAWGCPAPAIRTFFKRQPKTDQVLLDEELAAKGIDPVKTNQVLLGEDTATQGIDPAKASKGCSHHSVFKDLFTYVKTDKRFWVLIGVLLVTFIVGFPIFCLVCPIGLTFGSVSSLWHLFIDKQITVSAIVFPLALVIELIVYRKWCVNLCPIAGLLNVFGHFAKLFRPRVDASVCLLYNSDKKCNICTCVCPENINMHLFDAPHTLAECTRCGECIKSCPTDAITIETKASPPIVRKS